MREPPPRITAAKTAAAQHVIDNSNAPAPQSAHELEQRGAALSDAIGLLDADLAQLSHQHENALRIEHREDLGKQYEHAVTTAVDARDALRDALREFFTNTFPPLISALNAADAKGRTAVGAIHAFEERTGVTKSANWSFERFRNVGEANAVNYAQHAATIINNGR